MPSLLPPGSRIAITAPASRFDPDRLNQGVQMLRAWGYEPVLADGMLEPVRSLAASDDVRLNHLHWALSAPDIDAFWAVRGGYGVTRILQDIDWDALTPRPIIGFSDLTPLLDRAAHRGFTAIHGPVVHSLNGTTPAALEALRQLLRGEAMAPLRGNAWASGSATGPVVGGNLCLVAATCGTPAQLDATDCILVLEEVGEPAYRVDRMLQQLSSSGILAQASAIALGEFRHCRAPEGEGWHVDDVLRDHLLPLGVPVLANLPIGHGPNNHPFAVRQQGSVQDAVLTLASPGGAA